MKKDNKQTIEQHFIDILIKEKIPVSIYLANGIGLKGIIESHDEFTIFFKNTINTLNQLIYKNCIASILPYKNIDNPMTKA